MKRVWQHPEEAKTGRRYWRSIGELEQREDFLKNLGREFPNGDEMSEEERENSRRTFLKIMGASVGMMGLASCRRPTINILPYTQSVEWVVPGKPLLYATSMPRAFGVTPMVVTTHEGRPTHLSSNPLHPSVSGGLDAFAQSSILDLYDPDRSQSILIDGKKADAAALDNALGNLKKSAAADGIAILVGTERSPTADRLRGEVLKKFPKAKLYSYEAITRDVQASVNKSLLGAGVQPVVNLDKASRVFSLDCDFLGLDPVSEDCIAQFTKGRVANKPDEADKMNRLYVVENRYTLTGAMADHRKAVAASQLSAAAALLAAKIDPSLAGSVSNLAGAASPELKIWVETAADDLLANKGKAVVLAGSRTDAAVQALAVAMNNALGAYGPIIEAYKVTGNEAGTIKDLADAVASGSVKTLLSLTAADPVFDAPSALNLAKNLKDKKVVLVHLGLRLNATARAANIHIPAAHYLEAWGDAVSLNGIYSIVQPMIQPLFGGISEIEVLLALLDKKKFASETPKAGAAPAAPIDDPAYASVRESFAVAAGGANEEKWNFTLRDGFLKGSQGTPSAVTVRLSRCASSIPTALSR